MNTHDLHWDEGTDWDYGYGYYDYPDGYIYVNLLCEDEYGALAYDLDDNWLMEEYYESILDQYVPTFGGGTQPKAWWNHSRRAEKLEQPLRKRRRDKDIRVPDIWKFGRDMPHTWEARGRGEIRKSDTPWDPYSRANCKLRELQRANRRKARQSIRTMKMATITEPCDVHQFISDHMNF